MKIADDPGKFKKILNETKFKKQFPELVGDQLKTAPKGFAKDHPAIEYLRFKSFTVVQTLSDNAVLDGNFAGMCCEAFKTMRAFNAYLKV